MLRDFASIKILGIALLSMSLLVSACETRQLRGVLHGPARDLRPKDYPKVLKTWTKSAKIYHDLDSKMFITGTFHSPEFRRVFALAFPDIYGHGGNVTRRELVDLTDDIEQYFNFFVAVYTADRKWNDLSKPDSIWRLSLEGSEGVTVSPSEIVQVKIDANLRAVYPYIDRFDKAYLVRFKLADPMNRLVIEPSSDRFKLRIVSALGGADLEWLLVPPPTNHAQVVGPDVQVSDNKILPLPRR